MQLKPEQLFRERAQKQKDTPRSNTKTQPRKACMI